MTIVAWWVHQFFKTNIMKKQSILALAILVSGFTFSQEKESKFVIPKNTIELTGNVGVVHQKRDRDNSPSFDEKAESFNFNISPNIGYAIKDNLITGLGLSYSQFTNKAVVNSDMLSEFKSNGDRYGFYTYLKKFFPINNKLAMSLRGEVRYWFGDSQHKSIRDGITTIDSSVNSNGCFFGIRPGVNWFISKKMILKANFGAIGYSVDESNIKTEEDNYDTIAKIFNFSLNSNTFSIGLTFLLN